MERDYLLSLFDQVWINQKPVPCGTFDGYSLSRDGSGSPVVIFRRVDGGTATYQIDHHNVEYQHRPNIKQVVLNGGSSRPKNTTFIPERGKKVAVPIVRTERCAYADFGKVLTPEKAEDLSSIGIGSDGCQIIGRRRFKTANIILLSITAQGLTYSFPTELLTGVISNPPRKIIAIYFRGQPDYVLNSKFPLSLIENIEITQEVKQGS